jgi:hypothetical protein
MYTKYWPEKLKAADQIEDLGINRKKYKNGS